MANVSSVIPAIFSPYGGRMQGIDATCRNYRELFPRLPALSGLFAASVVVALQAGPGMRFRAAAGMAVWENHRYRVVATAAGLAAGVGGAITTVGMTGHHRAAHPLILTAGIIRVRRRRGAAAGVVIGPQDRVGILRICATYLAGVDHRAVYGEWVIRLDPAAFVFHGLA
jgi:hypothetical protein